MQDEGEYYSQLLESRDANILEALKGVLIEKLAQQNKDLDKDWFRSFLDKDYVQVVVGKKDKEISNISVVVINSIMLESEDNKNIETFFHSAKWVFRVGTILVTWSGKEAENLYNEASDTSRQPYRSVHSN